MYNQVGIMFKKVAINFSRINHLFLICISLSLLPLSISAAEVTKEQIKANGLTQTINDLKLKLMEQHTVKEMGEDDTKKDEKQIQ